MIKAAAAVVATMVAAAPSVNWHEQKSLVHGSVDFHVTRVVANNAGWSVTATVTNNSGYTIDVSRPKAFDSRGLWTDKSAGFGVAVFVPPRPNTTDVGGYLVHPARTARPALPTRLAAHATWTGTFSASDRLPRKSDMRVSFGLFTIAAAPAADAAFVGQAFDWVTDHSFRRAS